MQRPKGAGKGRSRREGNFDIFVSFDEAELDRDSDNNEDASLEEKQNREKINASVKMLT